MTEHKKSPENLAIQIVDSMDLKDLLECQIAQLTEFFENNPEEFERQYQECNQEDDKE